MGQNIVVFVQELRRLRPNFIITQAVYGYPQVYSESLLTVKGWNAQGQSSGLLDSIGLMVYNGADSLNWVGQYSGATCTQYWCAVCNDAQVATPCTAVPRGKILAGLDGAVQQHDLDSVCSGNVGGYMVWYASADNGFQYGPQNDARINGGTRFGCRSSASNGSSDNFVLPTLE